MAIRRRRKTLTNLLSTMERRVTKVELRPINLLTTAQVAGATAGEDETLDPGPDSVVSLNAPNQYKAIVDGYFYSSNVTGGKPLVELYFESDPELEVDKTIRISGVNKLRHNSTAVDFDISKDYKTIAIDTPPYTGRKGFKHKFKGEACYLLRFCQYFELTKPLPFSSFSDRPIWDHFRRRGD